MGTEGAAAARALRPGRSALRLGQRLVAAGALLAAQTASTPALAQFILTGDKNAPADVVGFELSANGSATLTGIVNLASPLGGSATQGRWTVGDVDRDANFEVVFTFPILANQGRLPIYTYDTQNQTYLDRGVADFSPGADGRIFAGDVDGDGRAEALVATFGNATPQPRPGQGGSNDIFIVDFQDLQPLTFSSFTLPGQFITRHSQFAARDITGDGLAELLMLSQEETGASPFNEPLGAASLYACSPVLARRRSRRGHHG